MNDNQISTGVISFFPITLKYFIFQKGTGIHDRALSFKYDPFLNVISSSWAVGGTH